MNPILSHPAPVAPGMRNAGRTPAPTPPAPLPRGQRLGHLELQGLLADPATADAQGGNAAGDDGDCLLYRAWDQGLARRVVIAEYLPPGLARRGPGGVLRPLTTASVPAYTDGMKRFIEHSRALAAADDPSLVRVLHLVQTLGTAYRVMPWTPGQRLLWLRRRMDLPPDEAALRTLLDEVLGALQALHRGGHVHGAVHPARILVLDSNDRALLLAAPPGAARQRDGFAAPEQFGPGAAAATGPWSDCYALGQVARFCISGLLPDDQAGTAAPEALAATVERLYFDRPEVHYSAGLLEVLDLATAPERTQRPQTAEQFRAWLAQPPRGGGRLPAAAATATAATNSAPEQPASVVAAPPPDRHADGPTRADTSPQEPILAPEVGAATEAEARAAATTLRFIQGAVESSARRVDPPLDRGPAPEPEPAAETAPAPAPAAASWATAAPPKRPDPLDSLRAHRPMPAAPAPRRRPFATVALLALAAAAGLAAWTQREPAMQALAAWQTRDAKVVAAPALPAAIATETAVVAIQAPAAAPPAAPEPTPAPPAPLPVGAQALSEAIANDQLPPTAAGPTTTPAPPATRAQRTRAPQSPVSAGGPRQQCGDRTPFALYRCMQSLCAQASWRGHAQCLRLKRSDRVD